MKSTLAVAAATLLASGAYAQMQINTPGSLVQCQPTLLNWSGGQPPYFLSVDPGNQPGATALEQLGEQNGTSFTWLVNIAANTLVGFTVRDSTGATAQTAAVPIQDSGDSSCVGKAASSGGGSAATTGGSAPTSAPSATSPGSSGSPATTTGSGSSGSTTPRSSSGSGSGTSTAADGSNTGAASVNKAGFFGVAGAVALAMLS